MTTTIAKVAVPVPLRKLFDYVAPEKIQIGARVLVSFGRRQLVGVVMEKSDETDCPKNKLKKTNSILDEKNILSESLLQLCQWASEYYHHPIGEVISCALPILLRQGEPLELKQELYFSLSTEAKTLDLSTQTRAPKQVALLNLLKQHETGLTLDQLKSHDFTTSTLNALKEKNYIKTLAKMPKKPVAEPSKITLNLTQLDAINSVEKSLGEFKPFLLEGVTGSGKTEVYLKTIQRVLNRGEQALVLIPEISLTPQTISRFQKGLGVNIAVLHSKLTDRERLNAWLLAKMGHAKVIIGTRSAVFTPAKKLGVIIIDESHDLSYKQQDGFRYSARDLAMRRAQLESCPIVLGTATPSLESLHNAKTKRYQHLHLPHRTGNAGTPGYQIIDLRNQKAENGLSIPMLNAINEHLRNGNQVLLFLNRRGFAPTIMCHQCGWIAECTRCNVNFVYHQSSRRLRCHHCDGAQKKPTHCPDCQSDQLKPVGVGTERLEETLSKHFPDTKIQRVDRDTTRRKNALNEIIDSIQSGAPQILIGTQMLAKGHHFPNVTLVGVIDADSGFFSADFRAVERMGQLLIQVAGRAGRAEKNGEVFIQTHQPHHPLLKTLITQGYQAFAKAMLQERRDCELPPYRYFALLRAEAPEAKAPEQFLKEIKKLAEQFDTPVSILGPIPAPMPKRAGRYRAQLLFQSDQRQHLHQLLKPLIEEVEQLKSSHKVRWSLDIDPMEMF